MSIVLERLTKRYEGHPVVNDVSLEVADGEMFVLLGPSGSGKSTVLRMVAGLADVDVGRILLHGRDVTHEPPQRRGVGLVFQNYALFRHMTVAENIEFALRIRKAPSDERRRRRDELLDLVGLAGFGGRMPRQLSGGQQQRVALARALAHRPEVLLLDEPFGALDARIRGELRRTILGIQRELGVTTIFVTHDQEEAFELADRLGVMTFGRLLEVGPPRELYLRPQTEFVATFLGNTNLMLGETVPDGVRLGHVRFPLRTEAAEGESSRRVQVLFRPEDVAVKDSRDALEWPLLGEATVEEVGFQGSYERILLRLPKLEGVRPISPPAVFGRDHMLVEASRSQHQARRFPLRKGDATWVGVRRVHALVNPGLSFLLLDDGSRESQAALDFGAEIARRARARATLLALGGGEGPGQERLRRTRERLRAAIPGIEARWSADPVRDAVAVESLRRPYDLAVQGVLAGGGVDAATRILEASDLHVLLVPDPAPSPPRRALLCVAPGEPGKEDVLFAGRFLRHLGAVVEILTVVHDDANLQYRDRAERFLEAGVRTLGLLGVAASGRSVSGRVAPAAIEILSSGGHDLLVIGAPLPDDAGRMVLGGVFTDLLAGASGIPVLIVRPQASEPPRAGAEARR